MKRCPKCAIGKPLDQFNKNVSTRDGLCVYCRDCVRVINAANLKTRGSDPIRKLTGKDILTRFEAQYQPEPMSGCWIWNREHSSFGYGTINAFGRKQMAHRVAWQLFRGPIPDGFLVCHRCDIPGCVNPNHLFLGTPADNAQDMVSKSRQSRGLRHSKRIKDGIYAKKTVSQLINKEAA
jgi:hypothetical protein